MVGRAGAGAGAYLIVVLACATLSFGIETMQHFFLPWRYSTWIDIVSNTVGGLAGTRRGAAHDRPDIRPALAQTRSTDVRLWRAEEPTADHLSPSSCAAALARADYRHIRARRCPMRVTAAVLYDVRKPLVIEDVDLLEPGPHEVLVRWKANGVCHSDLHVMTGDYPHPLPVVLGHEAAGVVEKIGPGVETVAPGDHVCSSYIPSCGKCWYCIGGQPTMCALRDKPRWFMLDGTPRFQKNGQGLHHFLQVSGYATHAVLPGRQRHPDPQGRAARRGLPRELRRAGRRGTGVQSRQGAAGGERGGVGLRRGGPEHDPGRAAGGRGQDHRGGRGEAEARRGRRSSERPTWWTRRRRIRSRACRR